ncbi:MAG: hypothetical protein U0V74_03840 [Chitinophagales bacterium]
MLKALPTIAIFLMMLLFNIIALPFELIGRFMYALTGNDEE